MLIAVEGDDIRMVKGVGHSIPDRLRRAVYERDDYRCVVPGCDNNHHGHQIDHVTEYSRRGRTEIYNLALLCLWHHQLTTHHGYKLKRYRHRWIWVDPGTRWPSSMSANLSCPP